MGNLQKAALAAAVSSCVLWSIPAGMTLAAGATGVDAGAQELPAVIVRGEKIQRSDQEVLSSVAVTTSADSQAHGDSTLQDILDRTPGIYTQSDNENWGIRGVPVSGFDDQGPAAMNGAVSVYVDDALQVNRMLTSNSMSLWDLEQVEVYRGSQSTSQGRNSLAGAIIMSTRKPTFTPEFSVRGNVGKYGEQGASAVANGPLIDGLLAGRLAVDYQSGDGYIRNPSLEMDANRHRSANIRGKLLLTPSEDADLLLTFERVDLRQGVNAADATGGRPDYFRVYENTETIHTLEQNTATARLDYRLDSNWTLTSVTSGTWATAESILDFDRTDTGNQTAPRKNEQTLMSQELRLNYESGRLKGVAGIYLGRNTGDIDDRLAVGNTTVLDENGDITIKSQALFGELDWEFVDRWTLIAGLRADHEKNTTRIDYPIDALGLATQRSANVATNKTVLLPKAGLSHELTENQVLGVTWQRGYRSGGVNIRALASHNAYEPEFTNTVELAWRGNFLDQRLRTNANVYYTSWKDQQVLFRDLNDYRQVANAGDSRMLGLEVSAEYLVTPQLRLTTGAAINNTKYKTFVSDGLDYSGEEFLFAPKYMASVGANYRFANGLTINADVNYQSYANSAFLTDSQGKAIGQRRSDGVVLANANIKYQLGNAITLTAYVHNVFDKRYITNNQSDSLLDVGAPLTAGMAARYDF